MTLRPLIDLLKAATGPDRALDAAIYETFVGLDQYESIVQRSGRYCIRYYPGPPMPEYRALPAYTKSFDAALKLLPNGHDWTMGHTNGGLTMHACVGESQFHFGETPVLAFCIAALEMHEKLDADERAVLE